MVKFAWSGERDRGSDLQVSVHSVAKKMAFAQSFTESGSDEVKDGIVDACSYCATKGKLQPATHFCFDCGVYGRYICGECLQNHNMFVNNHVAEVIVFLSSSRRKQMQTDFAEERRKSESLAKKLREALQELDIQKTRIDKMQKEMAKRVEEKVQIISSMEKCLENSYAKGLELQHQLKRQTYDFERIKKKLKETQEDNSKLVKQMNHLEKKHEAHMDLVSEAMTDEKRKHNSEMQKLTKDRDDIRHRLSDPNRAMKLSERFGQLYDDEWTNAFESLSEKKLGLSLKEAIGFLLQLLQDCWSFCNSLLTSQIESLHNVFLHPAPNIAKIDPRKNVGGLNERHRIGSNEEKALRELRRMIDVSPAVVEEVKQSILLEAKSWSKEKTGYDKKYIDACAPYIQRCAEVCWLMAVHDPPLYMKMDVKPGETLDHNVYTVYSSSGNIIDFLVWPSLFNGKDGGLLAKGVAEPQRIVGKKK